VAFDRYISFDHYNTEQINIMTMGSKTLYFMFGLVSVLGLIVPTVASNKDDPIKSLECKLQSVKGGVNSLKQSVEAGKVLEIELRREIIDLKDQLNERRRRRNNNNKLFKDWR